MLVFAADHAYCEAHGIDIDVMLAVIAVFGEDRSSCHQDRAGAVVVIPGARP